MAFCEMKIEEMVMKWNEFEWSYNELKYAQNKSNK